MVWVFLGSCKFALELWRKKQVDGVRILPRLRWLECRAYYSAEVKPDQVNNLLLLLIVFWKFQYVLCLPWQAFGCFIFFKSIVLCTMVFIEMKFLSNVMQLQEALKPGCGTQCNANTNNIVKVRSWLFIATVFLYYIAADWLFSSWFDLAGRTWS